MLSHSWCVVTWVRVWKNCNRSLLPISGPFAGENNFLYEKKLLLTSALNPMTTSCFLDRFIQRHARFWNVANAQPCSYSKFTVSVYESCTSGFTPGCNRMESTPKKVQSDPRLNLMYYTTSLNMRHRIMAFIWIVDMFKKCCLVLNGARCYRIIMIQGLCRMLIELVQTGRNHVVHHRF